MLNASSLLAVSNQLVKKFGKAEARIWILFTVGQFHACWWAGRSVPNVGALAMSESRSAFELDKEGQISLILLSSAQPHSHSHTSFRLFPIRPPIENVSSLQRPSSRSLPQSSAQKQHSYSSVSFSHSRSRRHEPKRDSA